MSKNNIKSTIGSYFPILKQCINGHPLIYADNASTAQVPQSVIDAMSRYYTDYKANVGRGVYTLAEKATQAYDRSRVVIATYIGARKDEIVFTSNATQGINLVADAWAAHHLSAGDEIILSSIEHHSNFLPWQQLALKIGVVVKTVPIRDDGTVLVSDVTQLVTAKTKLIAIVHTSNVSGATIDVTSICQWAQAQKIAVLVDATQSIAHQAIDVTKIGCDFLVFSGHKLYGPTGVGVLYVASNRVPELRPWHVGGGMVYSVGTIDSVYRPFPHGFEAGTPNVAGVIGLAAAVDFIRENINLDALAQHETELVRQLLIGLRKIPGIKIMSMDPDKTGQHAHIVTFVSDKYHAHDIAAYLDRFGIAVRAGNHCVQQYHQACGINASVRVSFAVYNTMQEVDCIVQKLQELLV